jgi:class 3 adenylate cyclase
VNLMAEEGTLADGSLAGVVIPDGVKEALGRRLNLLSEEANALLQTSAVVGREFHFDTLELLFDGDDEQLVKLIEEGLEARVIEELERAGAYRFTHAQMQETLLNELSTTRRVRLHGSVGEALELRWGTALAEERAARLARHFVEAATLTDRHAEQALRYSKLAAEQAETQAAWGEAARRYEDCLAVLADVGTDLEEDEASLLTAWGLAATKAGTGRTAWRALMRAIDIYRRRGDAAGQATATIAALDIWAPPERARSLADEAIDTLAGADPVLEARLLGAILNRPAAVTPDPDVEAIARRAEELGTAHGIPELEPMILQVRAATAWQDGRLREARTIQLRRHELFDQFGMIRESGSALRTANGNLHEAGRLREADEDSVEALAYLDRYGLHDEADNVRWYAAERALVRGESERYDALVADRDRGVNIQEATALPMRAELLDKLTRNDLPDIAVAAAVPAFLVTVHAVRARLLWRMGEHERAAGEWDRVRELATDRVADAFTLPLGPAWPGLATREEREEMLAFLSLEGETRFWNGIATDVLRGSIALSLGLIDDAAASFEVGQRWWAAEAVPLLRGQCLMGLADVARQQGNLREAQTLLDRATTLFREGGFTLYLNEALRKKLELQGGAGSADSRATIDVLTESIDAERPDLASRVAPDGTVTILFSDIESSTALNVELGDDRWMELLGEHNRLVRSAIAEHRGYEVKTEGDAFMVAFQSARDALRCAIDVQRAFEARNEDLGDGAHPVRVRVGLHTGEPVREGSDAAADFYGTHVVMASRIASLATGGEVLVSALLRELVASSGEFTLEARPPAALKGLDGEHVTYAVGWA